MYYRHSIGSSPQYLLSRSLEIGCVVFFATGSFVDIYFIQRFISLYLSPTLSAYIGSKVSFAFISFCFVSTFCFVHSYLPLPTGRWERTPLCFIGGNTMKCESTVIECCFRYQGTNFLRTYRTRSAS